MRLPRLVLFVALMTLAIVAVTAETIAVSVRSDQPPSEWTAPLLADVEEGVMEALFDAGHIVFDLPAEYGQDGDLLYRDTDQALAGGAARLLFVTVSFGRESVRGIAPDSGLAAYVSVPRADELSAPRVSVAEIGGYEDMTPAVLSRELGQRIALAALDGAQEVAW